MPNQYIDLLEDNFLKSENKDDALYMKKYLKDKFNFYGIKTKPRREISKAVIKELGLPDKKNLYKIIKELWKQPQREYQYFGVDLCVKYKNDLNKDFIKCYEYMIMHKSWWDTVDSIAVTLVGNYLNIFPEERKFLSNRYVTSNNMWLNRTSILFQLKYKNETDLKILYYNILKLKESKEFFIQKAIGWALREYSKTNPAEVLNFVNKNQLASLSTREALRIIKK
jgi:3-methyladenine DNA glycosylase AlkD